MIFYSIESRPLQSSQLSRAPALMWDRYFMEGQHLAPDLKKHQGQHTHLPTRCNLVLVCRNVTSFCMTLLCSEGKAVQQNQVFPASVSPHPQKHCRKTLLGKFQYSLLSSHCTNIRVLPDSGSIAQSWAQGKLQMTVDGVAVAGSSYVMCPQATWKEVVKQGRENREHC